MVCNKFESIENTGNSGLALYIIQTHKKIIRYSTEIKIHLIVPIK